MRLPADCPHRVVTSGIHLGREDLSRCCRGPAGTWLLADEEPLCRTIGSEGQVYRFAWRSSFDGNAVVRIGSQDCAITLRWRYDWFRTPTPDDAPADAALSPGYWARFRDALIAANFWALDPIDEAQGLDGAQWFIEGRRGKVYRGGSRWSPRGEVHALGRLLCPGRAAVVQSQAVLKQPDRQGSKRATVARTLKSLCFRSIALAGHWWEPTKNSNPTNHMPPGRRRCFYLAVLKSGKSGLSCAGVLSPNLRHGAPDRHQRNAAPERCRALAECRRSLAAAPGSRSLPPDHSYPAVACEIGSGDTPVIPVDARTE